MQCAIVEAAPCRTASDADHRGGGQFVLEDRQHGLAVVLVERAERVVQKNPARPMQKQAGKGEALLFLQGQCLIPALLAIERGRQMAKPNPLECARHRKVFKTLRRCRVADAGAKRAQWNIGPRRHVLHGVPRRQVDGPGAPGPEAGERTEQGASVRTMLDNDLDAVARRGALRGNSSARTISPESEASMPSLNAAARRSRRWRSPGCSRTAASPPS
jgi:hypothetical protein